MHYLKTFPVPTLALLVSVVMVAYLPMVLVASAQEPGCGAVLNRAERTQLN
jgi:hypothetical protein